MIRYSEGYDPETFLDIYAIETECFPHGQRFSQKTMKLYLRTNHLLTAWDGDTLVGTLLLKANKSHSYVSSVGVLATYRGQGIAGKLMLAAEKINRGDITKMKLHVRVDNPAQKLYFDLGYRVTKVVSKFYSTGTAALLMEKAL